MLRQAARRALLAAQQHQQRSGMSTAVAAAAVAGAARRLAVGVPALGLGTFAAVTDEPHKVAYRAAMIPVRLGRDVWAAVAMLAGERGPAARRRCCLRGGGCRQHGRGSQGGTKPSLQAPFLYKPSDASLAHIHTWLAHVSPLRPALHVHITPLTPPSAAADYSWTLRGLEGEAREEAKQGCHQRGAHRLLAVCFANGGIYIKLGQHIGMLVRATAATAFWPAALSVWLGAGVVGDVSGGADLGSVCGVLGCKELAAGGRAVAPRCCCCCCCCCCCVVHHCTCLCPSQAARAQHACAFWLLPCRTTCCPASMFTPCGTTCWTAALCPLTNRHVKGAEREPVLGSFQPARSQAQLAGWRLQTLAMLQPGVSPCLPSLPPRRPACPPLPLACAGAADDSGGLWAASGTPVCPVWAGANRQRQVRPAGEEGLAVRQRHT